LFDTKVRPPRRRRARQSRKSAEIAPAVLSAKQAAIYLNLSVATLKAWRASNFGPRWRRRGARLIAYKVEDLDAFLARVALPGD
jgi:hypothetical protein